MTCNIIRDLLPLYIDECCSPDSRQAVEVHLRDCPDCRAVCDSMRQPLRSVEETDGTVRRIDLWKASFMQTVLLLLSFLLIVVGVAMEAATPTGFTNGFWACTLVIPATGALLSLANWCFVRLYRSRRAFVVCSSALQPLVTLAAFVWALFHYEMIPLVPEGFGFYGFLFGPGLALTIILCVLQGVLSDRYGRMIGKE